MGKYNFLSILFTLLIFFIFYFFLEGGNKEGRVQFTGY